MDTSVPCQMMATFWTIRPKLSYSFGTNLDAVLNILGATDLEVL